MSTNSEEKHTSSLFIHTFFLFLSFFVFSNKNGNINQGAMHSFSLPPDAGMEPSLTGRTLGISYEIKKQMESAHVLRVLLTALEQAKVHLLLYVLVNKRQSLRMNKTQLWKCMVLKDRK